MVYKIEDLLSLRLVPDISVGVQGQPWILGQNLCRKRCEWYWDRTQTTNKGIVFIDSIKLRLQKVTKVMLFLFYLKVGRRLVTSLVKSVWNEKQNGLLQSEEIITLVKKNSVNYLL